MLLLILVAAFVILDVVAYFLGVDTRDGFSRRPSLR
jgi:hypothetical protein